MTDQRKCRRAHLRVQPASEIRRHRIEVQRVDGRGTLHGERTALMPSHEADRVEIRQLRRRRQKRGQKATRFDRLGDEFGRNPLRVTMPATPVFRHVGSPKREKHSRVLTGT